MAIGIVREREMQKVISIKTERVIIKQTHKERDTYIERKADDTQSREMGIERES